MKKRNLIIVFSILALVMVTSTLFFDAKEEPFNQSVEVVNLNDIAFDNIGDVEALYSDGSLSFAEMKNTSDAILFGKVLEQYEFSPYSIVSKVEVLRSYHGKKLNQITIFQVKDENVLDINKEYMLFLGKQGDEKPDTFYIRGGFQGAFLFENNNFTNKDKIMNDELNSHIFEKSANEDSIKVFESLLKK